MDMCKLILQMEAEEAQRMVLDMSQQRSAMETSLAAAHQAITEAAARERELVDQLQKADEVGLPRDGLDLATDCTIPKPHESPPTLRRELQTISRVFRRSVLSAVSQYVIVDAITAARGDRWP